MNAANRRATRAHIRHFVADAVARKRWAERVSPTWLAKASTVSRDMVEEYKSQSVKRLASQAMRYTRCRAFMPGAYSGWPGDKPANDLWRALADGTPARFYDYTVGAYVERIDGAAI